MLSTFVRTLWARRRRLLATTTAVVLGVAFLAATLILGDTTKNGFDETFSQIHRNTDLVVRSDQRFSTDATSVAGTVDESLLAEVEALGGVAAAAPQVEGTARLVGADGQSLGGDGPPQLGSNWIDDVDLSPLQLDDGRAPLAVADGMPAEVVIDRKSADDGDLAIGDTTTVYTPNAVAVTVVGIATINGEASLGGATYVAFETDVAQRLLLGDDTALSSIALAAADGTDVAALQNSLGDVLPAGVETLTGTELVAELNSDVDDEFLGLFRTMLLAFAGIAVVVAAFSIQNTFTIIVAQRTRESALMRAIGGSRAQVLGGVLAEAVAVGVVATGIGFGAGVGIAAGLNALMESSLGLPSSALVVGASAVIVSAIVGIGTTVLAAVVPAIRSARVAPLAALRDVASERQSTSRRRVILGALLLAAGGAALVSSTSFDGSEMAVAGLGALGLLCGAVVTGPVVAAPAASVIGAVPAATRGIAGRLARRNAIRNPRRTAASASALMVGTAVVSLFTIFGASLKASINDTVDDDFFGDLVIIADGFELQPIDVAVTDALAGVDGVDDAAGVAFGLAEIDGTVTDIAAGDAAKVDAQFELDVTSGTLSLGESGVAVSSDYADEHQLAVGAPLDVAWADGQRGTLTVEGIYDNDLSLGDVFVAGPTLAAHQAQPAFDLVFVAFADGADPVATQQAVTAVTDDFGAPTPLNRAEYKESISSQVDGILFVVYGLLGVAILIAVLGIANTLSLAMYERRRELGVLRAIGLDRSGMRSSVRWESVIVAVFGAVGGIGLGVLLGWGLMRAVGASEGFDAFAVPIPTLGVIVALAAFAGIAAAVRPARRAARVDVLEAIASS